jgi:hypothetical protein
MNAATEVGSAPTSWIRLSESSRFSIPPQRLKLWISPATACTHSKATRGAVVRDGTGQLAHRFPF